jgi:hypothetical protein
MTNVGVTLSTRICEWYASDNLCGTLRGSRKKLKAGQSPTGRLLVAVLCRGLEKNGMVGAGHGRDMASVNQTRLHCVNQMGKTHSKPLVARHGRGMTWARHGMCESALRAWQPGDSGVIPGLDRTFFSSLVSRLCLGAIHPPVKWVLAVKWSVCKAYHSPSSVVEVKNK